MSTDKLIKDILAKYDEDFTANTWLVPGGKARAIKHQCIERMAAKAGIGYDSPRMICDNPENVVIIVTGWIGRGEEHRVEWSFGECSPKNNKNAYPYSMAEKRGKDRVALKLIGLHGLLYSEEEADDFKQDAPAQVAGPTITQQKDFDQMKAVLEGCETLADIDDRLRAFAGKIASLTDEQKERLRGVVRFVREARKVAA